MRALLLCALLASSLSFAQAQRAVAPPTGVVTGHVVFEDTQRPGRVVIVSLMRKPVDGSSGASKEKEAIAQQWISGRTAMDGSFRFAAVPVGEYWVVAQSAGYILPIADLATEEELKKPSKIMADFPSVLVTPERPAETNISLRRGGIISGHLRFDDGAPVPGVTLQLEPVGKLHVSYAKSLIALGRVTIVNSFKSDDAGAFRISGVAPGKYQLASTLQVYGGATVVGTQSFYTMGLGSEVWMSFYSPGTVHKAASTVFEIKGMEEIADADITINLSSMHSVSGRAVNKEDGHALNFGLMDLKDPSDKDLSWNCRVGPDGRFFFPYVPEGNYELSTDSVVDAAEPTDPGQPWNRKTSQEYEKARIPITVTNQDLNVPDVALAPKKPGTKSSTAAKADD